MNSAITERIILVYYNLDLVFIGLAIVSISYDNIVLSKLLAETWECGDIRLGTKHSQMVMHTVIWKRKKDNPAKPASRFDLQYFP